MNSFHKLLDNLNEEDIEKRTDLSRREKREILHQAAKRQSAWKDRLKRGGAPANVRARFKGKDRRRTGERRSQGQKGSYSLADVERVLSDYSGQKKG